MERNLLSSSISRLLVLMFSLLCFIGSAQTLPDFGAAAHFVLFTGSGAVGNTGTSNLTGDIGCNVGAITGFESPTVVHGTTHAADVLTAQAATAVAAAYTQLYGTAATNTTHTPAFGTGETLTSGVYSIVAAGSLSGTLTLDAQGDSNAVFIFKFGGAFTAAASTTVTLINGATADHIFWVADGAISVGAASTIEGTLVANGANSMGALCVLHGRMYAVTGAISVYSIIAVGVDSNGTVSSNQSICYGTQPSDLTLSGNGGNVVKWQSAADAAFTSPTDISNVSSILTAGTIGNLTVTTYFRAVVESGVSGTANSAYAKVTITSTTWNGTSWSNFAPTPTSTVTFTGDYNSGLNGGGIVGCTVTVAGGNVIIMPNDDVDLIGALTVTSGSFTLSNNANLIQSSTAANSGNIIVKRNSSDLLRLDYTLWSSPVAAQNQLAFSSATLPARFYTYKTSDANPSLANSYVAVPSPSTTNFTIAKGYLIRMPNTASAETPTPFHGSFNGIPNNGDYPVTMEDGGEGQRFNLVGNPYPSPMSISQFVADNSNITGSIYFWRKTNNALNPSYCSWAPVPGYAPGTFTDNGEAQVADPNGIIQTGQGFFVEANGSGTDLMFNNGQRISDNAGQFFRTTTVADINRIWLNVSNTTGAFSQMALCYIPGATQGIDAFDAKYYNDGPIALNSIVNNADYVIQARALPFAPADVVPLSFKATAAGDYTIAIDHMDGLFSLTQDIFLRDNQTAAVIDLKAGPYTFTSASGRFDSRFEIIYQNQLAVVQPPLSGNNVVVYKQGQELVINTGSNLMSGVKVFDIRGRLLVDKNHVNANETRINTLSNREVLMVQVTSETAGTVTKKVIN